MRRTLTMLLVAAAMLAPGAGQAAAAADSYEVRVTNLTRGQILSPPLVVFHARSTGIFTPGRKATPEMAALAEDADASGLMDALDADAEVTAYVLGDGVVLPGQTATFMVDAADAERLSVVSMLVSTNDAFMGLDGYDLSDLMTRTSVAVPAYDAGSERNSEECAFVPGPPCGNGGVRNRNGSEKFIHVHPGIRGDGDLSKADLDWRNPVARVLIIPR